MNSEPIAPVQPERDVLTALELLAPGQRVVIPYQYDQTSQPASARSAASERVRRRVTELLKEKRCLVFWCRLPPVQHGYSGQMARVVVGATPDAIVSLSEAVDRWWHRHKAEEYRALRKTLRYAKR